MPVKRKMPGGGTLSSWAPGESGNPKGRPRKIALSLKNEGYKKAQVQQTIDKMAALTKSELEEISKNKNATVLELGIAKMISDYIKKGKTEFLEYIVSKKQTTESTINVSHSVEPTKEFLKKEAKSRNLPEHIFDKVE